MTDFKALGIQEKLLKSIIDIGFVTPTPIQTESIPFLLKTKQDLIALAQTGTENDKVEFELEEGPKGMSAINVKKID